MSFPYYFKYAENANGATRIHSLAGKHVFMFNWDGSCAWMYVDSSSNWIKLGPCNNDLSAKQDVNQYLTETRVFSHAVAAGAPYQQEAFENLDVSKAGYRAVALSGYV